MKKIKTIEIVKSLCDLGERQLSNEILAREYLISILEFERIKYHLFSFISQIPKFKKSILKIDGEEIKSLPTGLISGNITDNFNIISSLTSSQDFLYKKNINFNPLCSSISKANFYFAPSFAINFEDVSRICKAERIEGELEVEKIYHECKSILVGNLENPKNIVFSHFDSIEQGAIDNASGTAISLSLLLENREILEDSLFVFDSNEEISYDEPIYWGHGYREFENKYFELLKNSQNILVIDCVAYCKTEIIEDSNILKLAFPIKNMDLFKDKIKLFSGDFKELMKVYQSPIDSPDLIKEEFIEECKENILSVLKNLES